MYKDKRKARKIEINRITQNLKNANDEQVTRGFDVMKAKEIQQKAKEIYERDEKLRPSTDLVRMVQDLRSGRKMRRQKEERQKHLEHTRSTSDRGR